MAFAQDVADILVTPEQVLSRISPSRGLPPVSSARLLFRRHAAVAGLPVLTRDARRYRTYFSGLQIVSPRVTIITAILLIVAKKPTFPI